MKVPMYAGIALSTCAAGLWVLLPNTASKIEAAPARRVLRIGADSNNLPFTNERREGFENRIAGLLADELDADIQYVWKPQRRSFMREMLKEGQADIVIGVPADHPKLLTTKPYYRSSYVFVQREAAPFPISCFDDQRLKEARIGVHLAGRNGTPPAHALSARGLVSNLHSYALYGDPKEPSPAGQIVAAVAEDELDVAIIWGPIAGYFAKQYQPPLRVTPVSHDAPTLLPQLEFDIAVGVRNGDTGLRDEIDAALVRRKSAIQAILREFGVPRIEVPEAEAP
jgi:mxaJ protein